MSKTIYCKVVVTVNVYVQILYLLYQRGYVIQSLTYLRFVK